MAVSNKQLTSTLMSQPQPALYANFLVCKMKIKIAAALGGLSIG